jgi:hypothetical protein
VSERSHVKVTFDSNAWEALFYERPAYPEITQKITAGSITPYVCEISICLESIKTEERENFFRSYLPKVNITHERNPDGTYGMRIQVSPNTDAHPGLSPTLLNRLLKARELGFKVIRMANFGTVRSAEIPEDMLLKAEEIDSYWAYADRFAECREFIESLGCGCHDYEAIKRAGKADSPEILARAIAEWVDGDSLALHYAFRSDVFCTKDRGRSAGAKSIFYPDNRAKLKSKFSLVILTPEELLQHSPV